MAKSGVQIKFQVIGRYRGTEIYFTNSYGVNVFIVWLDKFYSADNAGKLIELVDAWWLLRWN